MKKLILLFTVLAMAGCDESPNNPKPPSETLKTSIRTIIREQNILDSAIEGRVASEAPTDPIELAIYNQLEKCEAESGPNGTNVSGPQCPLYYRDGLSEETGKIVTELKNLSEPLLMLNKTFSYRFDSVEKQTEEPGHFHSEVEGSGFVLNYKEGEALVKAKGIFDQKGQFYSSSFWTSISLHEQTLALDVVVRGKIIDEEVIEFEINCKLNSIPADCQDVLDILGIDLSTANLSLKDLKVGRFFRLAR